MSWGNTPLRLRLCVIFNQNDCILFEGRGLGEGGRIGALLRGVLRPKSYCLIFVKHLLLNRRDKLFCRQVIADVSVISSGLCVGQLKTELQSCTCFCCVSLQKNCGTLFLSGYIWLMISLACFRFFTLGLVLGKVEEVF